MVKYSRLLISIIAGETKMKKKIGIIMVSVMCLLSFAGCSEKKESTSEVAEITENVETTENEETAEVATETEAKASEYNKNIPDEYKDLFVGGSFDENMVWTTNNSEYKELIESIQPICEESLYGSIILASDEEVIFAGGWNVLEIDGETTVNAYTTYEVGSITKQIMAAAILQLVDEGKLDVSETIDKYFPEYPHGDKLTIEHLLHMESGIPDYVNEPTAFYASARDEGKSPTEVHKNFMYKADLSEEQILEYLYKTDLAFEPGTRFSYSNTNYFLLAIILEQVTGQTYEDYIKENIFEVCGMENSTCTEVGNITSVPMPKGVEDYGKWGRKCRGAGDIHSNVCDYLLWCRGLMNGKVLDETQLTYMTTPSKGYACGWFEKDGNMVHDGGTISYFSLVCVYPTEEKNYYLIYMNPYLISGTKAIMEIEENFKDYIK